MDEAIDQHLPPEQRLALSYSAADLRPQLRAFFALDGRLGQIVAKTTEPMLGQMRLAWWRDVLGKPTKERPIGDLVLDAIGRDWAGSESALVALVDGWELMLAEEHIDRASAERFAELRSSALAHLAQRFGEKPAQRVHLATKRWAAADAASHQSRPEERDAFLDVLETRVSSSGGIPSALRGIAVLEALALRSLRRGGRPLMEGRGAALVALRAGLIGR